MPIYVYDCPKCGQSKEIVESMSAHTSGKTVRCKCKGSMKQRFSGGIAGFVQGTTLGGLVDKNTDKMSLDQKISLATKKYEKVNPMLDPDIVAIDKKANIARTIKEVTEGHNR